MMWKPRLGCGAAAVFAASSLSAQAPAPVRTFPLRDTTGLIAPKVKSEAVKYLGRDAVRITMDGEDHSGLALLPGTDFQDGVIEADIAPKITTPPGIRYPGFVGIAFRARPDSSQYELFYLRPGNSDSGDRRSGTIPSSTPRSRASAGTPCAGRGRRSTRPTRIWPWRPGRR